MTLKLRTHNPSTFARRDVISAVVPLPRGLLTGTLPNVVGVEGALGSAVPFGRRWDDGSFKYAKIYAPIKILASDDLVSDVIVNIPQTPPGFKFADSIVKAYPNFQFHLEVDGDPLKFTGMEVIHSDHAVHIYRMTARDPDTPLWADVIFEIGTDLDHVKFNLAVGCSNIESDEVTVNFNHGLRLIVSSATPVVRFAQNRGIVTRWNQSSETFDTDLLGKDFIGDGQALSWEGSLLFNPEINEAERWETLQAELQLPMYCVCINWREDGNFGPWGKVPLTPWLDTVKKVETEVRNLAMADFKRIPMGDPWMEAVHGCNPRPADTGAQRDFGVGQMYEVVESTWPTPLYAIHASVLQEFCRPVHFMTKDVQPIKASDHPDCRMWSGRPHYDKSISPDQLGKTGKPLKFTKNRRGGGWRGHDRQHYSVNYLTAFTLLTGHHRTLMECKRHVQTWLMEQPRENGLTIQPMGPSRGIGRVLAAAAWLYEVTGDEELLQRMQDRVDLQLTKEWSGMQSNPPQVRCFTIYKPEARGLPESFWAPWQETVAVRGLDAVYRLTGNVNALTMAKAVARDTTMYAYRKNGNRWEVGYQLVYNNGIPLSEEEKNDPNKAKWGANFETWAHPMIRLGRRWAEEDGDDEWKDRCQEIIDQMERERTAPSDNSWDRWTEWLGVV